MVWLRSVYLPPLFPGALVRRGSGSRGSPNFGGGRTIRSTIRVTIWSTISSRTICAMQNLIHKSSLWNCAQFAANFWKTASPGKNKRWKTESRQKTLYLGSKINPLRGMIGWMKDSGTGKQRAGRLLSWAAPGIAAGPSHPPQNHIWPCIALNWATAPPLLLPISRRELFLTGVLLLCSQQRNEVPRLEDHRHQFWSDPLPPLTNYAIVPLCHKNQFPGNKDSLPNENFNILFWMTGDVCSTNNAFSHHQCVGALLEDTILLIINCQRFLSKCAPSGDTTISAVNIFLPPIHPLL